MRTAEIREVSRARLLMFLREPEAFIWVFLFPIFLAGVLALAFRSKGPEAVRVGLVGAEAAARGPSLAGAPYLETRAFETRAGADEALRRGTVDALLLVENGIMTLRYDPVRPTGETARMRATDAIQTSLGRTDPATVRVDLVEEKGSRYIDWLLPGIIGMNLMGTGLWGSGFAIVDMRQKKLLKRLMVTPMRRSSFLLGQIASRLLFLVLEVAVIAGIGAALGVPLRGSLLLFAFVAMLGAMMFSGLGLLVASRAQTIEGVSGLMNLAMIPMWLFSGIFFSYERYPEAMHPFIRLLPLTPLNEALREVMLVGAGPSAVAAQLATLAGWTVVTFVVALRIFRWK